MSVTKKLEAAITALDKKELKKALYLTDRESTRAQHESVKRAASVCLDNKDKPKLCDEAISKAKSEIVTSTTTALDDTSLEGLEEFMEESTPGQPAGKTDAELYEACEECHIGAAVAAFQTICEEHPTEKCPAILEKIENPDTSPKEWMQTMAVITDGASGAAKEKYTAVLADLVNYLDGRSSPYLKEIEAELNKP